mmetsp:Transcript_111069/g.269919  ORF Transcript_111069/g.269919 Transcript_111069/m.269919 type:complete len:240 (-) Transcript_111069:598-1317(-)
MAALVPPHVAPFGKSALDTWQMVPVPISSRTCLHKPSSLSRFKPATESSACAPPVAEAAAIASDRTFMTFKPSSRDITPAATSAANSPTPSPATAPGLLAASGATCFSFSRPARHAKNITGWQTSVFSSLEPGPLRQTSRASQPRMVLALLSMSFTAGMSFTSLSIFTYCEPWPGNSKPMGKGFTAGAAANEAAKSCSSSSGSAISPPYLAASRPCFFAAPGRLKYQPLAGGFPNSQHP